MSEAKDETKAADKPEPKKTAKAAPAKKAKPETTKVQDAERHEAEIVREQSTQRDTTVDAVDKDRSNAVRFAAKQDRPAIEEVRKMTFMTSHHQGNAY